MMKDIAWKMFKNTGNIDTFLELRRLENVDGKNIQKVESNEYRKDERNNNCRK